MRVVYYVFALCGKDIRTDRSFIINKSQSRERSFISEVGHLQNIYSMKGSRVNKSLMVFWTFMFTNMPGQEKLFVLINGVCGCTTLLN